MFHFIDGPNIAFIYVLTFRQSIIFETGQSFIK